jgi:ABC-type transporter Mla subunit MlaD
MSMDTRYFRLGLFVLAGIAVLVAALFALGAGMFSRQPSLTVESYFTKSVSGIMPGSTVEYLGVQVGTVDRVTLTADVYEHDKPFRKRKSYVLVRFTVKTSTFGDLEPEDLRGLFSDWIQKGLRVRSQAQGLTGESNLEMSFVDNPERHPPLSTDWEPKCLYMPSAENLTGSLSETVGALQRALSNISEADIGGILKDVDGLVANVNRATDDLRQLLEDPRIKSTIADASASAAGVRKVMDESGQDISEAIQELNGTLARLHTASDNLPQATADLQVVLRQLSELLVREHETILETFRNLEQASENVRALSEEARDYPSGTLFGEPPPKIEP